MKSKFLVAIAATLALTACTTTNPYTGQSQISNTAGGALIGTGGGAVAGAMRALRIDDRSISINLGDQMACVARKT